MSEHLDLTAVSARIRARKRAFKESRQVLAAIDEGSKAKPTPTRRKRRRIRLQTLKLDSLGLKERVHLARPASWFPLLCVLRRGVKHRVEDACESTSAHGMAAALSRLARCVFRVFFLAVMVPAAALLFFAMSVAVLPVLLLSCVRLSEREAPTWFARVDGAASRELILMTSPVVLALVVALVRVTLV